MLLKIWCQRQESNPHLIWSSTNSITSLPLRYFDISGYNKFNELYWRSLMTPPINEV